MFCASGLIFDGIEGVRSIFMFCSTRLVFGSTEVLGSFFMFCAHRFVFSSTESVRSCFHVLRTRTRFRRYRGRRVPFFCFACPDSFSAVSRASSPVYMFCAPGLVFGGTDGVGSHFHVMRARTRFRRYRGRRVPFSCFARSDSFLAVPRASGPVFIFCALELIFSGNEGVGSRFHFLLPDSFSAVPRASGPVFMFCSTGLVFDGNEGVGSRFHVFRHRLVCGGTEGVGSRFHVFLARAHFRLYRWRRVPFTSFALLDSFSTVPRASGPIFMFCAPGVVFGDTEGVGYRFIVLLARTHFRRYRGRRVPFSYFARSDSFSALSSVSGPYFMFCAPVPFFAAVPRALGPVFMFCSP
jgi:hypothetical protein